MKAEQPAPAKISWFTKTKEWFTAKFGKTPPAPPAPAAAEPTPPAKTYPYHVRIYTGAGVIKMRVDATDRNDALMRAKIAHVQRIRVEAELYDK